MKKQRKQPKAKASSKKTATQTADIPDRRRFLRLARNAAIAVPVVGVAGFFSVRSVQATICEADLTKIGQGKPAIVQIHDPGCQLCRTLQKQTRRALRAYEDHSFTFLVANITTAEGGELAARYGVPHVTLLLFDGDGKMVQVVRGPTDSGTLEAELKAHMRAHGA
ncbi:MAG: thioredoxin family protein [Pseudomonadota bacterium]